jgi:hypothetical protein
MPAPAYEAKSTTGEQYAAMFVPAIPAETTSGDLLIACCWMTSAPTDSAPAGWTQALAVSNASGTFLNVFWKIATGSESAPMFSASYGSYGEAILYRFSGTHDASPINVTGTDTGTLSAPSVTTTVDDTLVLHLFGSSSGSGMSIAVPAGDTALDEPSNFYCSLSSGYTTQASAGATGTAAFDDGAMTSDQVTATLAIAPASGGSPPPSGIVLERGLQHFWPLSDQDGSDVWAGDAFGNPPHPSVGTLSDAASSPHPTLGATRLTNEGHASTAAWEAGTASFDPTAYTFAGWFRTVYPDVVQRGFQAGIDPSQNNIGGIVRHSDNAKTYGLDGGGGVATRDVSPSYEYGNWQFACLRVSSSEVSLNVDAEPAVTDSRGIVRSPGSTDWRLFVNGNGASIAPVECHGWGVWNRPLSDDEVTALFNGGTAIAFPLLTNGEPEAALSLQLPGDMTPRLLPQPEPLAFAASSAVSPVLTDVEQLSLQPAGDMAPPVLPLAESLTLDAGKVSSPSLPVPASLTLATDSVVSPVVSQAAGLTLQPPGDMTPPVLPVVSGLTLTPLILGPELPEFIAGLSLQVGEPGAVLPPVDTLTLEARLLGSIVRTFGLALGSVDELFRGLTTSSALTLSAATLPGVLPSTAALMLSSETLSGQLLVADSLQLSPASTLFASLTTAESLTLAVGLDLLGPNDVQSVEALTLAVSAAVPDPRLLTVSGPLSLSLSGLPGTLSTPVLALFIGEAGDARLLTRSRQLMLRADRFATHSFERVNLTGLRARRARLQSLSVTN